MHPNFHEERRWTTPRALHKKFSADPNTRFTDAAKDPRIPAFTVTTINTKGEEKATATIIARDSDMAKKVAIFALAISTCTENAVILSNLQSACHNFKKV